jgi:hypothetical protein
MSVSLSRKIAKGDACHSRTRTKFHDLSSLFFYASLSSDACTAFLDAPGLSNWNPVKMNPKHVMRTAASVAAASMMNNAPLSVFTSELAKDNSERWLHSADGSGPTPTAANIQLTSKTTQFASQSFKAGGFPSRCQTHWAGVIWRQ